MPSRHEPRALAPIGLADSRSIRGPGAARRCARSMHRAAVRVERTRWGRCRWRCGAIRVPCTSRRPWSSEPVAAEGHQANMVPSPHAWAAITSPS